MELQIGTIQDYNNKIVIATEGQELGLNNGLNAEPTPPRQNPQLQGTSTKQAQAQPDYYQKYRDYAKEHNLPVDWVDMAIENPGYYEHWIANHPSKTPKSQTKTLGDTHIDHPVSVPIAQEQKNNALQHEDNKTALIVGSIVLGFAALLIYEIY